MKCPTHGLTLFCFALLLIRPAATLEAQELKARYTAQQGKIDALFERTEQQAAGQYARVVDSRLEGLQQAGNLDGLIAAKQLKEQLAAGHGVPDTPFTADPAIEKARLVALRMIQAAEARRRQATTQLLDSYARALPDTIKQLVQQGEVERAVAMKTELGQVKEQLAAYRAAQAPAGSIRPSGGRPTGGRGGAPGKFVRLHIDAAHFESEVQLAEIEFYAGQQAIPVKMTAFSSEYNNGSWSHGQMIDGNTSTGWANGNEADGKFPQFFVFESQDGRPFNLSRVRLHTWTAGANRYLIKEFSLYTSMDGVNWRACLSGSFPADQDVSWKEFPCRPTGRAQRFTEAP